MSDLEYEKDGSTGIKILRFHGVLGENCGLWRIRSRALCRLKGVWCVVEHSIDECSETTTLSVPNARQLAKSEKSSGIMLSELGDAPHRVVLEADDDLSQMISLLNSHYASRRTVSRIAV